MSMNIKIKEDFYVERYDFFCVELKGMTIIDVEELDGGGIIVDIGKLKKN
jgi:hypothetical protein